MATSAPKAVPKAAAEEAPVKKSNKKLMLIVAVVVLLAAGAGAYFMLGQKPEAAGVKAVKVEAPKPPVFVTMEAFTVNLQSDGGEQFLQLSFTLQVADAAQADLLKLYNPQVRSRLLLLLSSKKAADINTAEGKKKLGTEIMATVNQPFTPGGKKQEVTDVFFTSFVIQ
ncbi:MAG: flagellar basal body-associated protein FliL [Pseudomonadota bacterium]